MIIRSIIRKKESGVIDTRSGNFMITFENVTKKYDEDSGLMDVSFHIEKGSFVFLVGPSGAGKSTIIKLILKEVLADSGSITADGTDVCALTKKEIPFYRRRLGIVFQDFRLLDNKTVYENVAFAMEITGHSKDEISERVPAVLDLMGIGAYQDRYPGELSAGEQQRVSIARAVMNRPALLICDEPTGNLDPETAAEIMDLLQMINKTGTTILMVTHAKDIVDRMNKRVISLEKGRIVSDRIGAYDLGAGGNGDGPETPVTGEDNNIEAHEPDKGKSPDAAESTDMNDDPDPVSTITAEEESQDNHIEFDWSGGSK